jgi:serine/threonine protein kinase
MRVPTERQDAPDGGPAGEWPPVGGLLAGRYRVHGRAEGGFAVVAMVRDDASDQWFALKIPKAPDRDIEAFRSEAGFWLQLPPHTNIVRAFQVLSIDGRPALQLEYVGGHAFNTVRSMLRGRAPLDTAQALRFARQIAIAMEFANRGGEIGHLDLKPENLMVTHDGVLKVTDFSLARRIAIVNGRYPFVTAGTWPYVPPEWFDGKPSDSKADLYAWGVILHEMLTGRVPFPLDYAGDLHAQMKAFYQSKGLQTFTSDLYYTREHAIAFPARELICYCLQWYPGERPRSFGEILTRLERIAPAAAAPDNNEALTTEEELARAVSMFAVGQGDTARALLNQLMVRHPADKQLWLKIADILAGAGGSEDAASIRERF